MQNRIDPRLNARGRVLQQDADDLLEIIVELTVFATDRGALWFNDLPLAEDNGLAELGDWQRNRKVGRTPAYNGRGRPPLSREERSKKRYPRKPKEYVLDPGLSPVEVAEKAAEEWVEKGMSHPDIL